MATKQRTRSRRSNFDRGPRHVEPVLDPTWQSPYVPSTAERLTNQGAVRRYALRRRLPLTAIVAVTALALLVGAVVAPWLPILGVVVAALGAWDLFRFLSRYERKSQELGATMLAAFSPGGTAADRQRLLIVLDRLAATFGVDGVNSIIVDDPCYNAALVPNGETYSLFVTNALVRDLPLIELEGVVAHCLARQRLGLLARESAACTTSAGADARLSLAGAGQSYRADEVAAAAIRYPLGLAGALRKCAAQTVAPSSFFASPAYAQWRWVWFDLWTGRPPATFDDLDDVTIRARALEEW